MKIHDTVLDMGRPILASYRIDDCAEPPADNEIIVADWKGWFEYRGQELECGYYHLLSLPDGFCCAGCRGDFGRVTTMTKGQDKWQVFYGTRGGGCKTLRESSTPIFLFGPTESVKFPGEPDWFIRFFLEEEFEDEGRP